MHLLSVSDLDALELREILTETTKVKSEPERYCDKLINKTLVLLFEKPSTRTKVSFEAAMVQLGGHPITLDSDMSQLSRGETPGDSAKVLSRYTDALAVRVFRHQTLVEMADKADIPVINSLSDLEHPCQAISDMYTINEVSGGFSGVKLAYVGDGNNVCNSLILCCKLLGVKLSVATPQGYEPDKKIVSKSGVELVNNPEEAVEGADFIYTDVWVGMGDESEKEERMRVFKKYQINNELLKKAKKDCRVMHCLPAHRGLEITDEVMDSRRSIVWGQAENRMHTQKAILLKLIK